MFEGIAKTNTTHTKIFWQRLARLFEGIAKTNTTHTIGRILLKTYKFEGIAKTNTTHTFILYESKQFWICCFLGAYIEYDSNKKFHQGL